MLTSMYSISGIGAAIHIIPTWTGGAENSNSSMGD